MITIPIFYFIIYFSEKIVFIFYSSAGGPGGRGWWSILGKWTTNPVPLVHRLNCYLAHGILTKTTARTIENQKSLKYNV